MLKMRYASYESDMIASLEAKPFTQQPWVFSGGSYSGALAAWVESTSPGTFWAYHASSAPVQAIYDYVSQVIKAEREVILKITVADEDE